MNNILYRSQDNTRYVAFSGRDYVVGKIRKDAEGNDIFESTNYFTYIFSAVLFLANQLAGKEAKSLASYGETLERLWGEIKDSTRKELSDKYEKFNSVYYSTLGEWDE